MSRNLLATFCKHAKHAYYKRVSRSRKLQSVIFHDRIDAANKLVEKLMWLLRNEHRDSSSIVVLSIPRGGVVIGDVVADKLDAKLDVVVSRKIGAPIDPEVAIGAVMPDGTYFLNDDIMQTLNVPQNYVDEQVNLQMREIERRLISFRGGKEYDNELKEKTVVLVDDGIATGATIISAARWLKTKQNCQELIIAVPVAPRDTVDRLKQSWPARIARIYWCIGLDCIWYGKSSSCTYWKQSS
jgi:putative phosphoribosyl transferase